MNIFMTLYRFELKKIMKRRLVWVALLICIGCIIIAKTGNLSGNYYVDGKVVDTHYHMFLVDNAYSRALSGRVVGQELLEEMTTAYGKIPVEAERYTETEEYQKYARPYNGIFQLVWKWTQSNPFYDGWQADEQALYDARTRWQEETWTKLFLSDVEKEFWKEKEAQIWQSLPMCFLSSRGLFSQRLVEIGGQCFTVWQVVPMLYVLCGIAVAVGGLKIYRQYQVSGR